MEYLDGPTLEELVRESGPLSPSRTVILLRQLCGALAEAHVAGLVHRDLKPGNIIIAKLGGQRDVAKLLDFGPRAGSVRRHRRAVNPDWHGTGNSRIHVTRTSGG